MSQSTLLSPIKWVDDALHLLDQRVLPNQEQWFVCEDLASVIHAIREMVVRGAPAIGITAGYGAVLAYDLLKGQEEVTARPQFLQHMRALAQARPTAVNLAWAVELVLAEIEKHEWADLGPELRALAHSIHTEDVDANQEMGRLGAEHMKAHTQAPFSVITHCNTGSLATGGYGTALGVIRSAYAQDLVEMVYADETRPWLQGARLTAWELRRDGIPVTLNADACAAWLMSRENIRWVIVGADRITANGDVANKIGTYSLAVVGKHHGVKVMVVAPSSTVDMSLASGQNIEIEERHAQELTHIADAALAPEGVEVANPVFDVTPADLVDVIVTEKGVIEHPNIEKMQALFS